MPLTASVESGQSSPSCRTGGGTTAVVGVGTGGGAWAAGGTTGVLTPGSSPGSGVGGAASLFADGSVAAPSDPLLLATTTATMAATMTITSTATPIASALRRR